MKKIRWQLVIILLTGLVVGVLLVTQKQPAAQPAASPEPTTGGVYTEALVGSFKRFNPILDIYNPADRDVDRLIFSGLIRFDFRGLPQADLAESWGVNQDGTIYNFLLRENLVWHDGKPITTEDVVYTLGLLRSDSPLIPEDLRTFWEEVEVVDLDKRNLQFRLPESFAPFLDYLTVGILPKHLLGDLPLTTLIDSPFNMHPVGSGPFRFDHMLVENDKVTGVVLSAFDQYYGKKPFIQQVVFRYYPDAEAALQAYQGSEVQGISYLDQNTLSTALTEPGLAVFTGRQPGLSMVLFNLDNDDLPFFQDAKVRRALLMSINRQWIVDRILKGQAFVADGPLFPDTWAYYGGLEKFQYDKTGAEKLLIEAGYTLPAEGDRIWTKSEKPIQFQLFYPDDPQIQMVAEFIQKSWTDLGVSVSAEPIPYDQLIGERLEHHDFQAALIDLNLTGSPDPDPYPFWDQAQIATGQNYSGWNNRAASEYLEQARIVTDAGERARLYRNFQVLFVKEMPALPLFYPVSSYAVDRQVQGVQMGPQFEPSDRFTTITDWFLVAKRAKENPVSTTSTP